MFVADEDGAFCVVGEDIVIVCFFAGFFGDVGGVYIFVAEDFYALFAVAVVADEGDEGG